MNDSSVNEFLSWGSKAGIPVTILQDLIVFAAKPEILRRTIDEMLPPPPIFPVNEIRAMQEKDPMGINPGKSRFLIIGSCPNGDPIAVDIGQDAGSVWYLSHEQMFDREIRSAAVKVAASIVEFCRRLAENDSFPLDFWDAS